MLVLGVSTCTGISADCSAGGSDGCGGSAGTKGW